LATSPAFRRPPVPLPANPVLPYSSLAIHKLARLPTPSFTTMIPWEGLTPLPVMGNPKYLRENEAARFSIQKPEMYGLEILAHWHKVAQGHVILTDNCLE